MYGCCRPATYLQSLYNKAKQVDDKYHVIDKTKVAAVKAADKASEINKKHKITDRIVDGVGAYVRVESRCLLPAACCLRMCVHVPRAPACDAASRPVPCVGARANTETLSFILF